MKFSIIMPLYNAEMFLEHSVNSVLNQTYQNFELILVNDGSSDQTLKLLKSFNHQAIKIIDQVNSGVLTARNNGIKAASGHYLVFIDADDLLVNNALEILLKRINDTNADVLLYQYKTINKDNSLGSDKDYLINDFNNHDELLNRYLYTQDFNSIWAKCIKRTLINNDDTNFNDFGKLNMNEDRLHSFYTMIKAKKISFINKSLYLYRINENSLTEKFSEKSLLDAIKVYDLIHNLYDKYLDEQQINKLIETDAIQIVGKYLRYNATNKVNRNKKKELIKIINENETFIKASRIKFSGMNKLLYNSVKKNKILTLNILTLVNKLRIKFKEK